MSTTGFRISVIGMLIVAGMSIGEGTRGGVLAAQKAPSPSRPGIDRSNEALLSAASSFEDLTENALAGNKNGMQKALKAFDEQAARVSKLLSPTARHDLEVLVATIKTAEKNAENESVALNSVEAYRTLIESLDISNLTVPVQVSMLDYAGFKLKALLRTNSPDWSAARKAAEEAHRHWTVIESRVSDKGLRDAVNTMIAGMNKATAAENIEMAVFCCAGRSCIG